MIWKLFLGLVFYASLSYYYDVDLRDLVEKSRIPAWLESKGVPTRHVPRSLQAKSESPGSDRSGGTTTLDTATSSGTTTITL